jgi:hypothetical protein
MKKVIVSIILCVVLSLPVMGQRVSYAPPVTPVAVGQLYLTVDAENINNVLIGYRIEESGDTYRVVLNCYWITKIQWIELDEYHVVTVQANGRSVVRGEYLRLVQRVQRGANNGLIQMDLVFER